MPRHGIGIDISTLAGSEGVVTTIDDFVFESFSAGQMHPILTTSRTNLVLQSETWNHNSWTKNASTVEANQIASPLDLSAFTADLLKEDSANAEHWVRSSNITASLGQTFTMSFYAKAKERTFIKVNFLNSGVVSYNVWINLSNGAITSKNANLTVTTELIGSGFYRITLTAQAAATTLNLLVALATGDANDSYAGDGSSGAYVFGAQVEQDNFVSNYIPTVGSTVTVSTTLNDTSEVWDFDSTDIMLEADPEDEGFWEEGSNIVLNGDYEELGSELVDDGNFLLTGTQAQNVIGTYWTTGAGWSISGGTANANTTGNFVNLTQNNVFENGKTYKTSFTITNYTQGEIRLTQAGIDISGSQNSLGTYETTFTSSSADGRCIMQGLNSFIGSIDNVSVKQVDPNDRWSLTGGTSISDGKMTVTGASGTSLGFQSMLVQGTAYELTYTISNFSSSSGNTDVINNDGTTIQNISGNGTFTVIFTHSIANGNLIFRATSGTNSYQVDNVTVREYAIQPKDI